MIKRVIDLVAAACGLVLVSPVLAVAALLIKTDSPGPVFFVQERVGRHFRPFRIVKLRTMRVEGLGERRDVISPADDPRVTRIGRLLRETKIDELPQLYNVLRGDMSLVGPRPEVGRYVEMFRQDYREILRCRPGITDLASLKYRDEGAVLARARDPEAEYINVLLPDKIRLAKEYVSRQSVGLDLSILFRSIWAVVAGSGRPADARKTA